MVDDDYFDDGALKSCIDALNDDSLVDFLGTLLEDTCSKSATDDLMLPDITQNHFDSLPFQNIPSNLYEVDYCEPQQKPGIIGSNRETPIYVYFKPEDISHIASKMRNGSAIVAIKRSGLNRPNFTINIVNKKIPRRRHPYRPKIQIQNKK